MEFVFIIGVARTGSKIYRNTISGCTDIDILNEMHYLSPRWIRKDFRRSVKASVGLPTHEENIDSLLDLMYGGTLNGTFWRMQANELEGNENCIHELRRDILAEHLRETDSSFKAIIETVMRVHAEHKNKARSGAKFPANIACLPEFLQWFPEAQYVHITRDPRAIYASMKHLDLRRRSAKTAWRSYATGCKRLAYLVHQYRWAARVHTMLAGKDNYRSFRFEDMVREPEQQIKNLCDFLSVPFEERMLSPRMEDSSFGKRKESYGFDTEALERWRKAVSTPTDRLIRLLLGREMRLFEYDNN